VLCNVSDCFTAQLAIFCCCVPAGSHSLAVNSGLHRSSQQQQQQQQQQSSRRQQLCPPPAAAGEVGKSAKRPSKGAAKPQQQQHQQPAPPPPRVSDDWDYDVDDDEDEDNFLVRSFAVNSQNSPGTVMSDDRFPCQLLLLWAGHVTVIRSCLALNDWVIAVASSHI
jgi:hypothetical protein